MRRAHTSLSTLPLSLRPAEPQTTRYGETVARELFPDVLPYVVGTPATYGFAKRNGRTVGGQRTRSNAVPGRRNCCALGVEGVRREEPTKRQVPVCRTSITIIDARREFVMSRSCGHGLGGVLINVAASVCFRRQIGGHRNPRRMSAYDPACVKNALDQFGHLFAKT
jgi:hypothetical protein